MPPCRETDPTTTSDRMSALTFHDGAIKVALEP